MLPILKVTAVLQIVLEHNLWFLWFGSLRGGLCREVFPEGNTLMATRSQPNGHWGIAAGSRVAQEKSTSVVVVCRVEMLGENDADAHGAFY